MRAALVVAAATVVAVALPACDAPDTTLAAGVLSSRAAAATVAFGPGWDATAEPARFRAGLPGTLAEARHAASGTSVVVTFHDQRSAAHLGRASALDLLAWTLPSDAPVRRLPACDRAVERVSAGADGRRLVQVARRTDTGLLVLHAWGDPGREPGPELRALACAGVKP